MSNYTDLISRLNKKTGPINLSEIIELLEKQTLPAGALGPGSVEQSVAEALAARVTIAAVEVIDARVDVLEAGQAGLAIGYATRAAMDADLAHADGVLALVTNDPTTAYNQMYRKSGESGSGSWVPAVDRVALVEADLAELAPAAALQQNTREGDLFAMLDSAGRVLQLFRADGTLHAKFALTAGAGLVKTGDAVAGYSLAVDAANLVPGQGGLIGQTVVEGDVFAIIDTNGRVLLRVRKDGVVLGRFQVDSSELAAARGSRGTLGDRLSQGLTPYGIVDSPIWGEWHLRETRQRLRLRALGEAGVLTIAAIGDSWTHGTSRWCGPLATVLASQFGDAGPGWVGLSWYPGNTALVNGNARTSVVGYTPDAAGWSTAYATATGPDICSITSSTVGAKQTVTGPADCSAVVLHYLGGSDTVRYRWDGGAWSTLDLSAGSGPLTAALTGLPATAWTLEIEIVSGSSTLFGLDVRRSTSGVRFHKLGATGSRAEQWATVNAAAWQTGLAALAPNLVVIMHGTNDQGSSRTPSAYRTDIDTIITRVRAAAPAADILLVAPCENQRANSVAMADYADQLQELAVLRSCAFLDLQPFFGLLPVDYAAGSARPWFNADTIHPEPASGGRAIVDAIHRLLTTR